MIASCYTTRTHREGDPNKRAIAISAKLKTRKLYSWRIEWNGEVLVASIFNPFNEEIHPASKLADEAYVERHFPKIVYARKTEMVKRLYGAIASDPCFINLPEHYKNVFSGQYKDWEPINPVDISHTLSKLPDLRKITDFYLRNFAISITQDAIRMQFNCDGTHIVSAADYQHFLEKNLIAEEGPENS